MEREGILVLFLTLEKKLLKTSDLTIHCNVDYELVVYGFYFVEVHSLCSHFVQNFILNRYCILSNAFSASIDDRMIFGIHFVNVVYQIDLHMLPFLYPLNKSNLILAYDYFKVLLNFIS